MDDENVSVEPEMVQVAAPTEESQGAEETSQSGSSAKQNDAAYNWAEMRKAREEDRKRLQELERISREQKEFISKITSSPAEKPDDELDKLGDEDIITKRQALKLAEKKAQEIARQVLKQREAETVDERLQFKFSDFNQVVTQENIELLKQTKPVLANSLRYIPDAYEQGMAAYEMIKEVVAVRGNQTPTESLEMKKANENLQKPRSVQAVAKTSSLAEVNQFSEMSQKDKQAFLRSKYEEMQKAMKG
jgi:hypothetical protein